MSRRALAQALGPGYETDEASNGLEALVCLSRRLPHAVVSDWEMPKMNGLQLMRAMKSKSSFKHVPVILVTSHTERGAIHECFQAGAADYLPKPVDGFELRARVSAAVRSRVLAEELAEANRRLVRASRRAGQAEVASGVLHNVGNALNSVNISVKLLRDKAGFDVGAKLKRLHQLLDQHRGVLEQALGDRAALLLDYCNALSVQDAEHRAELSQEIAHLERVLDHTKVVISNQQALAHKTLVVAPVQVAETVRLAEEIARSALGDTPVEKALTLESLEGDECRIVQVLANLLSNAAEAVAGAEQPCVRLLCREDRATGTARFVVEDNGMGIACDDLPRLFEQGRSTKGAPGHGFGLHFCINAAREMDGDLLVRSDGPGRGATFELVVPLAPKEQSASERATSQPVATGVQP